MLETNSFQRDFGLMLQGGIVAEDRDLRRAVAVHRNTSRKASLDALDANFPVLSALVGEGAFAACAWAYIDVCPPVDPRLCLYGKQFPTFVANWQPFRHVSYLAAVARLEWLVVEALFAADADPLAPAALAAELDPAMPLTLHPATRIDTFGCPAASYWRAHQPDRDLDLATVRWEPEIALVTRAGLSIEVQAIDAATHAFLTAPTIGEAAVAAHELGGDVAAVFSALLLAGAFARPSQQV